MIEDFEFSLEDTLMDQNQALIQEQSNMTSKALEMIDWIVSLPVLQVVEVDRNGGVKRILKLSKIATKKEREHWIPFLKKDQ